MFQSYYKMPAPQTRMENCVAHNGSLIPIPGRDVMVQAWYQGGISVFDWTDAAHPKEIAFFDRGPVDSTHIGDGRILVRVLVQRRHRRAPRSPAVSTFSSSAPSAFISQNEIDAAKTVHFDYLNAQGQPKFVWPPSFPLSRAYVDQLERANAAPALVSDARQKLAAAEAASGGARRDALTKLASSVDAAANGPQQAKVKMLASSLRDLAAASR